MQAAARLRNTAFRWAVLAATALCAAHSFARQPVVPGEERSQATSVPRTRGSPKHASLGLDGMVQARYYATLEARDGSLRDDDAVGFQLNRARFGFRGSPHEGLTWRVFGQVNAPGGDLDLFDAWAEQQLAEKLSLRVGQFKLPFDRERYVTSPFHLATVDRSILDPVFALVRSQGVQLSFRGDRLNAEVAFSDGARADGTGFTEEAEADYAFTGRVETRLGNAPFSQFQDLNAFRGDEFGVLMGFGAHVQEEAASPVPVGSTAIERIGSFTADVSAEGDGWSFWIAGYARTIVADRQTVTDAGLLEQLTLAVAETADVSFRHAVLLPDNDRAGGAENFHALTAACTLYAVPRSHALKVTFEATWYPQDTRDSRSLLAAPNSTTGVLPDASGGQVVLSAQVQLLF